MAISKPKSITLDVTLYTKPAFYLMYMPVGMPYSKIMNEARSKYTVDESFGTFEKNSIFGRGYIGASISNPDDSKGIKTISGDFRMLEVTGPYKQLMKIDPHWKEDKPDAKEFYLIYKNTPEDTPEDQLITQFIYR
jgi:hypothetical protein